MVAGEVTGADADAEHAAGQGLQSAVWWIGQAVSAVTSVNAGDEHHEYGDYRAGQERGDNERHGGGDH